MRCGSNPARITIGFKVDGLCVAVIITKFNSGWSRVGVFNFFDGSLVFQSC